MSMSKEETAKWVLGFLVPLMIAHWILFLCGYPDRSFGAPINKWIFLIIATGNFFFYWDNKKEFCKISALAIPLSFLAISLISFTTLDFSECWGFGIVLFIFLIMPRKNMDIKRAFKFNLALGIMAVVFLVIFAVMFKDVYTSVMK